MVAHIGFYAPQKRVSGALGHAHCASAGIRCVILQSVTQSAAT
jgi:hypothetical protein